MFGEFSISSRSSTSHFPFDILPSLLPPSLTSPLSYLHLRFSRNLFERVLTQKLAMKKAKALFKKWMGLERRLALPGDDSGAEMVKAKAIVFVQKAASGSAGGGGGDEEMEE